MRHIPGRIRFGQGARLLGHGQQLAARVIAQEGNALRGQLFLRQQEGPSHIDQETGIACLMIIDRVRERHQNAGHARRRQFRHGQCTGPADHQVSPVVSAGHIFDERHAVGAHPHLGISGFKRGNMFFARLVHDLRQLFCRQLGHAQRHAFIQCLRAEAATDHQQPQGTAAFPQPLGGCGQGGNFRTHRITQPLPFRQHIGEAGGHPRGKLCQNTVSQTRHRILFMQDQRNPLQPGHDAAREGDVTAHAEHHVRLHLLQRLPCLPETAQQVERQHQFAQQSLAAQGSKAHPHHLQPMLRHQPRFHSIRITQPYHAPAGRAHFLRHCQGRENMPAGTAGHDQNRFTHDLPPRITAGFCLRPRCALNTGCAGLACGEIAS